MLKRLLVRLYLSLRLDRTRLGPTLVQGARAIGIARRPEPARVVGEKPPDLPDTEGVLVAFRVGGGIGDHLIAARYIRDLVAAAGGFRFDVYSSRPEVASWIFADQEHFNNCYDEYIAWQEKRSYQHYALAMWVSQFVVLYYESLHWWQLNLEMPKLIRICKAIDRFRHARELNEIIACHPRLDGLLGAKAVFMDKTRHDLAHTMSGIAYGGHALGIPLDPLVRGRLGLDTRRYVTVHNGFDAEFDTGSGFAKKSTKVYPYFDAALAIVRARFPDLHIVQLGSKTSRPIEGVSLQLMNKTTLPESAAILAGSMLHIDNESGLVHLAACVGTRSCVVFGPTPPAYFGYEDNLNIAPRTCGGCWWSTREWMTTCPRGFDVPICLSETPPAAVAAAIIAQLESVDGVAHAMVAAPSAVA